ncbi:hypothetical protein ACSBR2_038097 [Camellia fascicularis]
MIFHLPPIPFLVCFFQFGLAVSSLTKLTLRSRCEFRPDDAFDLNRLLPRQVLIYGPSGAQQLFLNHPCIDILKWSSCLCHALSFWKLCGEGYCT